MWRKVTAAQVPLVFLGQLKDDFDQNFFTWQLHVLIDATDARLHIQLKEKLREQQRHNSFLRSKHIGVQTQVLI